MACSLIRQGWAFTLTTITWKKKKREGKKKKKGEREETICDGLSPLDPIFACHHFMFSRGERGKRKTRKEKRKRGWHRRPHYTYYIPAPILLSSSPSLRKRGKEEIEDANWRPQSDIAVRPRCQIMLPIFFERKGEGKKEGKGRRTTTCWRTSFGPCPYLSPTTPV